MRLGITLMLTSVEFNHKMISCRWPWRRLIALSYQLHPLPRAKAQSILPGLDGYTMGWMWMCRVAFTSLSLGSICCAAWWHQLRLNEERSDTRKTKTTKRVSKHCVMHVIQVTVWSVVHMYGSYPKKEKRNREQAYDVKHYQFPHEKAIHTEKERTHRYTCCGLISSHSL